MKIKFMFLAVQPLQPNKKNGQVYPRVEMVIDDETDQGSGSTVVSCDQKAYAELQKLKAGDTKYGNFGIKPSYSFRAPELVFLGLEK